MEPSCVSGARSPCRRRPINLSMTACCRLNCGHVGRSISLADVPSTLSREEREIAWNCFPELATHAERELAYLRNRQKMEKMKREGFWDNGGRADVRRAAPCPPSVVEK